MSRARTFTAAVALALALSGAGCTKAKSTKATTQLRQPSSVAVFRGRTMASAAIRPYLVVANAFRNDLTVLDAETDAAIASPIKLRPLVLPVANRPSLLVAAPLGDDAVPGDPTSGKPDLLVAVSGGDSVLQVVETWDPSNVVHSDPLEGLAVDLGSDVIALAPVPSDAGTVRIAAVLAGTAPAAGPDVPGRIAVVTWRRVTGGEAIELAGPPVTADLGFAPLAVAAMPDDPAVAGIQTDLYVATLDPIGGVQGVAQIAADLSNASSPAVLGARAPTRLVAAARLRELIPGQAASGPSAFAADPVRRVYAVLDESGCGPTQPIDCGVVALDPGLAGGEAIPQDDQFMPYRAPMHVPGRPLALAVSGPPAKAPVVDALGVPDPSYVAPFMRLHMNVVPRSTTGAAAVASEDGWVYFLDLGRSESATGVPVVATKVATARPSTGPAYARPCDQNTPECKPRRIWLKKGADFVASDSAAALAALTTTPGFTRDQRWTVSFEGPLSSDLSFRNGEAGEATPGTPWLALQVGDGPAGGTRILNEVVRLWDPAFGIRTGDIVILKARAVGGACVGYPPATTTDTENEFEVEVAGDPLPPTTRYPGGAVLLGPHASNDPVAATAQAKTAAWAACFGELVARSAGTSLVTSLHAMFRAGGYVVTGDGNGAPTVGYVGRPVFVGTGTTPGWQVDLTYSDERALEAACPVATYGWSQVSPAPPSCDPACRASCERLAIVRKLRRIQRVSVDCATDTTAGKAATCITTWQGNASTTPDPVPPATEATPVFPLVLSPVALSFTFDVQPSEAGGDTTPYRDLSLVLDTGSNALPLLRTRGSSTAPYRANGAVAFDRSPWTADPASGYRFFVSYPADFVLDTTPSVQSPPGIVIR